MKDWIVQYIRHDLKWHMLYFSFVTGIGVGVVITVVLLAIVGVKPG